ncbi:HNH endonuclease signature motif containing protein [Streptomyces sp. B21-106]|uniref:HNH endonuclease n=1 Tax=Streptomyces sp. B21-106 TaxID=3039418 RepID=UPI002FF3058E
MAAFRCDHPGTPENTAPNGANGTCRTCLNARRRERYAADPEASRAANKEKQRKHRGGLKGSANARKDTCAQGHPFDDENTYVYKGARQCKICRRQRCRETYARNAEQYKAAHREWYWQNRDKAIALTLRWVKANPERAALMSRLKKQRRRAAGVLTAAEWRQILALYGNRCLRCGSSGPLTIDHVIPVSKGGPNTAANVQPLCGSCNSSKSTKATDYRPTSAAEQRM